jgi:hypothetical protein
VRLVETMLKPKVPSLSAPDLWKLIGSALKGALYPFEGKTGIWTFWIRQPEGLPEGSRRSPRVFGGGDLRATAQEKSCTHAGVPDSSRPHLLEIGVVPEPISRCENCGPIDLECGAVSPTNGAFWHPSRVLDHPTRFSGDRSPFALNDHRLPSGNPTGWPPPMSSAEDVQTPVSASKGGSC